MPGCPLGCTIRKCGQPGIGERGLQGVAPFAAFGVGRLRYVGVVSKLERTEWERRYRERGRLVTEPAAFVVEAVVDNAPIPGRALDVGGGTGRNALWLARRGWDVVLVDVSPTALEMAAADAAEAGLALATVEADLDADPLPEGRWDLAVVHHYLNRALFPDLIARLATGGLLVFAQPTVENLERNDRPGPNHSLQVGEALRLVGGLDVVSWFEGWTLEGRHEAQIVARKALDSHVT